MALWLVSGVAERVRSAVEGAVRRESVPAWALFLTGVQLGPVAMGQVQNAEACYWPESVEFGWER